MILYYKSATFSPKPTAKRLQGRQVPPLNLLAERDGLYEASGKEFC